MTITVVCALLSWLETQAVISFFFGCSSLTSKHFGMLENASQMEKVGQYLLSSK